MISPEEHEEDGTIVGAGASSTTAAAVSFSSSSLASSWNKAAFASCSGAASSAVAIDRLEAAFLAVVALRVLLAMGVRPFVVVAA